MVRIGVQISGLARLKAKIAELTPEIEQGLTDGINLGTSKVQSDAKTIAPVDKGTLKGSIHVRPAKREGGDIVGGVYTALEYAPYVEFGTGVRGAGSYPYDSKVDLSYGSRPGQVAQPFLAPALQKNEAVIDKLVINAVRARLRK